MASSPEHSLTGKLVTCECCNDTFTRQSSLNRHKRRSCKGLQKSRETGRNIRNKSRKKDSSCAEPSTSTSSASLHRHNSSRVVEQSHDKPSQQPGQTVNLSSNTESSNTIVSPADVKCINDLCVRLEKNNKNMLVVAVDDASCQWFGTTLGQRFSEENSSMIEQFVLYCRDKNNSSEHSTVKVKKDHESSDLAEIAAFKHSCNTIPKNQITDTNVGDSLISSDNGTDSYQTDNFDHDEHDSDDDYEDDLLVEKQEEDADTVDESSDVNDAKRKKFFQEIAEDFSREESTKAVEYILRKKCGPVKHFVYTVPDLNTGKYRCDLCGYNFLWKIHLDTHQAKLPKCNEVKVISNDNEALENKVTFVHTELNVLITSKLVDLFQSNQNYPIVCVICGFKDIHSREDFSRHLIKHYDEHAFKCNICCSGFPNVKSLSHHLREHFRKPYECHNCSWRFSSSSKLDMHIQSVCSCDSEEQSATTIKSEEQMDACLFKCTACLKTVTGHGKLREHMSSEHQCSRGPLECVLCEKKFSFPELYFTHLSIHGVGKHKCPYCSETFPQKSNAYHYHIKRHGDQISPFMCDMCGEKFKYKRHFDIHRRRHTGERPYVCPEEGCSKDFRSLDGLNQHKWTHKNVHFLCSVCGRKFKKPSLLNNHKRTHTEEWRYPCIYCTEKFHTLWRFKKHLAHTHPDKVADIKEKFKITLHPCEMCPKVYYEMEDYRSHMNTHKGIKPFACSHCGKRFTDKSNMKVHEKSHTGGKRLKCLICSRKFEDKKYLESHIERLHNPDKPSTVQPITYNYTVTDQQMLEMEDADELRERTLQIIDETIREEVKF